MNDMSPVLRESPLEIPLPPLQPLYSVVPPIRTILKNLEWIKAEYGQRAFEWDEIDWSTPGIPRKMWGPWDVIHKPESQDDLPREFGFYVVSGLIQLGDDLATAKLTAAGSFITNRVPALATRKLILCKQLSKIHYPSPLARATTLTGDEYQGTPMEGIIKRLLDSNGFTEDDLAMSFLAPTTVAKDGSGRFVAHKTIRSKRDSSTLLAAHAHAKNLIGILGWAGLLTIPIDKQPTATMFINRNDNNPLALFALAGTVPRYNISASRVGGMRKAEYQAALGDPGAPYTEGILAPSSTGLAAGGGGGFAKSKWVSSIGRFLKKEYATEALRPESSSVTYEMGRVGRELLIQDLVASGPDEMLTKAKSIFDAIEQKLPIDPSILPLNIRLPKRLEIGHRASLQELAVVMLATGPIDHCPLIEPGLKYYPHERRIQHAGAHAIDLKMNYDSLALMIESTNGHGVDQSEREMNSIKRHLGNLMEQNAGKPTYGLFVCGELERDTLHSLRGSASIANPRERRAIIPITSDDFFELALSLYQRQNQEVDLAEFITTCIDKLQDPITTADMWRQLISDCARLARAPHLRTKPMTTVVETTFQTIVANAPDLK